MIREPIGALLRRRQHGDHFAPRHLTGVLAQLRSMKRREIRKVAIGNGTGADTFGLVAGVLAEIMRFCRNPFTNHLHTFGSGGVDDFGTQRLQLIQRVAEDGYDHVVLAEALAFGFKIISGNVQRFHEREGSVL